jgi:serine O-acetyltransferase
MTLRIINSDNRYSLFELLRLDLLRFCFLSHGDHGKPPKGFRLWLFLLSPSIAPMFLYRLSHFFHLRHLGVLGKFLSCLNQVLFGIEIASSCQIGPGLFLPHTYGTVIGAWTIGSNVTIFQGVTLGARSLDFDPGPATRPTVGDGVIIGAGAKVLGGIVLGDNCRVGANSVVLSDLPPGCLAVGVPARVILDS